MPPVRVSLHNASLAYSGDPVVTGLSGEVLAGEAVALLGPNGSGKTTLLRSLLGMVRVVHGSMEVVGAAPGRARPGMIGYVPQVADLDPSFPVTALGVVLMGTYPHVRLGRRPGASERERSRAAIASVGLSGVGQCRSGELSGGQQHRVLLARCMVSGPKLVLLDEPFNGLDQPNRDALLRILEDLKRSGAAVVVSTHDMVLAQETCEKAMLLAGRQVAFGRREDVLTERIIEAAYGPGVAVR